jgi:phosphoenolpyruvate carboxykinase (ATP)
MINFLSKFRYVSSTRIFVSKEAVKAGIINKNLYRNLSTGEFYEIIYQNPSAMDPKTLPTTLSSTGAMVAYSGIRTG